MEETKGDAVDAKSEQSSEENFVWEEWTVIDKGNNPRNQISQSVRFDDAMSSGTSFGEIDNTSDAEEARECIEVLSPNDLEECPAATNDKNNGNDDSDGVSVITESDAEEPIVDANAGAIVVREDFVCEDAGLRWDAEIENLRMIFLVVCCLLGLAILCVAISIGARRNSDSLDSAAVAKTNEAFQAVEQSAEVNKIARYSTSDTRTPKVEGKKIPNRMEPETRLLPHAKDYLTTIDSSINDPDGALFGRLQVVQRTMCLLLEDLRSPETGGEKSSECETRSLLSELMNLRFLLKTVLSEMDASERSTQEIFLQNVESQIRAVDDKLIADFVHALDKLTTKHHKKLEKIGLKLAERLRVLRNTLPSESKNRKALESSDAFIENYDRMTTLKFDEPRKREKKNHKTRDAASGPDLTNKKNRDNSLKRKNNTRSIDTVFGSQANPWDSRKCYNKKTARIPEVEDFEETCPMFLAPPRSSWKSKRKSFAATRIEKVGKGEEQNPRVEKRSDKNQSKGDRGGSKVSKTKTAKEFYKEKNRKLRIDGDENVDATKLMKEKPVENSRSILSGPENFNGGARKSNKRAHSSNPEGSRAKKRFENEKENEFILLERKDDKATLQSDGHWQFDRSRIRDKLRQEDSTSNWYFDRAGSRKSSRMNCNDDARDPVRCGASR